MLNIKFHYSIEEKLKTRHGVTQDEVIECFDNVTNGFLIDEREDHKTDPPSHFFIAKTRKGRSLKVVFMYFADKKEFVIKSAFDANDKAIKFYKKMTLK